MLRLNGMKPNTCKAPSPRRPARFGVACLFILAVTVLAPAGCNMFAKSSDPTRQRPRPTRNLPQEYTNGSQTTQIPDALTVDAMVGQINGRPIYASQVFNQIGPDQLQRLGASVPRVSFREDVTRQIYAYLRQMVTDELVIAEAEQSLTEQEQMGLLHMLKLEREKILARFFGVPSIARQRLQTEKGMTLEEYLESQRQAFLVQKYLADRIWPKVHVTRREVERHYRENHKQFNPEPSVVLRIIIVLSEDQADDVDRALNEGKPFERVAGDYSAFRRSDGGLMPTYQARLDTFDKFKGDFEPFNEPVRQLTAGRHSPRIAVTVRGNPGFGWVYLEKVEGMEAKQLADVYLRIENTLRKRKFDELSRRYMGELVDKGNYTPVEEMLIPLVEVAMNRYAQAE